MLTLWLTYNPHERLYALEAIYIVLVWYIYAFSLSVRTKAIDRNIELRDGLNCRGPPIKAAEDYLRGKMERYIQRQME